MEHGKPDHVVYRRNSILLAGALLAVFVLFLILSGTLGKTAGRFPKLIAVLGIALICIEAGMQLKHYKAAKADPDEKFDPVAGQPGWQVFLMMVAYVPALNLFGFALASALFLIVTPALMGHKKWLFNAVYGLGMAAVLWLCFVRFFTLSLPTGWLLERFL